MFHHEQKLFSNRTFITDIMQAPSEQTKHIVIDNWKETFERTKPEGHFGLSYFLRLHKSPEKFQPSIPHYYVYIN